MQHGDHVRVNAPANKAHGVTGVVVAAMGWLGEPEVYSIQFDEPLELTDSTGNPDIYSGGVYSAAELQLLTPATPSAVS